MVPLNDAQLSLRRAFRIGYYAFLSLALLAIVAVGLWFFSGHFFAGSLAHIPLREMSSAAFLAVFVVACGLCVPLFFGLWSMVGTAVLGPGFRQPTIYENLRGC